MPNYGFSEYMRKCRRCGIIYRTSARCGRICPECTKPNGGMLNFSEKYVVRGKLTELALERMGSNIRGEKNE
jgi:hypothetical protein